MVAFFIHFLSVTLSFPHRLLSSNVRHDVISLHGNATILLHVVQSTKMGF